MIREAGFYWVKDDESPDWYVAEWSSEHSAWFVTGACFNSFKDKDFTEIDERRIVKP